MKSEFFVVHNAVQEILNNNQQTNKSVIFQEHILVSTLSGYHFYLQITGSSTKTTTGCVGSCYQQHAKCKLVSFVIFNVSVCICICVSQAQKVDLPAKGEILFIYHMKEAKKIWFKFEPELCRQFVRSRSVVSYQQS